MAPKLWQRVPIPELGSDEDVHMVLSNPWLMPLPEPLPDALDEAEQALEMRRRRVEALRDQVVSWTGITDVRGETLAPPREWPDDVEQCEALYRRVPMAVHTKIMAAVKSMELDHEWDPTRRPMAAAKPSETQSEPSSESGDASAES